MIRNTVFGDQAGAGITTGTDNSFFGFNSGLLTSTGLNNIAFGANALDANVDGSSNVAIGRNALGSFNGTGSIAIGNFSQAVATGIRNVTIGASSGSLITTGNSNILIGFNTQCGTTLNSCIVIGTNVAATAPNQIILGGISQDQMRIFGVDFALYAPANNNWRIASIAGGTSIFSITGLNNLGFGKSTLAALTSGGSNIAMGASALESQSTGSANIAIGATALQANSGGDSNVAIGNASQAIATGVRNVTVGASSGSLITTGSRNTMIGFNTQCGAALDDSIVIGSDAAATASKQIALGTATQDHMRMLGIDFVRYAPTNNNMRIASISGGTSISAMTGANNLGFGKSTLAGLTSGANNIAIGSNALENQATATGTIAIGVTAAQFGTALADCTYVGTKAGRSQVSGTGDTAIGFRSLEKATVARNNSGLGDSTLWLTQGFGNCAMGYRAAEYVKTGDDSIFIGKASGVNRTNGDRLVLIGTLAGGFPAVVPDINTGAGTVTAGDRVIGIGFKALQTATGSDHVAVGDFAGGLVTTAEDCVFIGSGSGNVAGQKIDAINSIAIGTGAISTKDNQAVIGTSATVETILNGIQVGTVYTVATLPAGAIGNRAFVSDADASTFNSAVVGGGANAVPVFHNGASWQIG